MSRPEHSGASHEILVDARGLEHPEPMERVLAALDRLRPGEYIRFLIHREPVPLYAILAARGCAFQISDLAEGCFELLIEHKTEPA